MLAHGDQQLIRGERWVRIRCPTRQVSPQHLDHECDVSPAFTRFDEAKSLHAIEFLLRLAKRILDRLASPLTSSIPPPPEEADDPESREQGEEIVPPRPAELEERALRLRDVKRRVLGQDA